jgi:hypothetical protein
MGLKLKIHAYTTCFTKTSHIQMILTVDQSAFYYLSFFYIKKKEKKKVFESSSSKK